MKVKIFKIEGKLLVDAKILEAKTLRQKLPSLIEGWRFNFERHAKIKSYEMSMTYNSFANRNKDMRITYDLNKQ